MKRFLKTKKGVALLATLVVVLAASIGAYAYFTSSGHTDGTPVAVGTSTGLTPALNMQLDPDLAPDATSYSNGNTTLLPTGIGDTNADVATVPFTVTNTSEANELLSSYTITIENSDDSEWFNCADANGGDTATLCNDGSTPCTAADFSINPPGASGDSPVTVDLGTARDLAPASDAPANSYASSFTVQLVDNDANQDNCEGVMPPIDLSATS